MEDDEIEIENGPEVEDEVVSTQSTRNKKNAANNKYSRPSSVVISLSNPLFIINR
jgi:hypothetical protein